MEIFDEFNLLKVDDEMKDIVILPGSELGNKVGFTKENFSGYLCLGDEGVIYISLLESLNEGKGNTRRLIKNLKSNYKKVVATTVISEILEHILITEGFKKTMESIEGAILESYVYESN